MPLGGFDSFDFTGPLRDGDEVTHTVYHRGEGPPIIIMQELPGIGPQTLRLALGLVDEGYSLFLPHLFGPLGKVSMAGNVGRLFCLRREYHLFAANRSSPIVNWLRALCHEVRDRTGADGVGTIGMCLTGGFALTLMGDDAVLGGVASQPSLPVFRNRALHMSPDEVAAARRGMEEKGHAIAMRYGDDPICRAAKFETLHDAFGDNIVTHTFAGRGHSLLTLDWNDAAFDTVKDYFRERLLN